MILVRRATIIAILLNSAVGFSPAYKGDFRPQLHSQHEQRLYLSSTVGDKKSDKSMPDINVYNVDAETAADLWTVSVSADKRFDREAGIPYLDSKSKDHFVDDVQVIVSRKGGMGIELLELAGGRDDDYGLTIVSGVSGNAEAAGVLAGDSIASVEVQQVSTMESVGGSATVEELSESFGCECKNFDTTIGLLSSFPPEIDSLVLKLKRIRRWPKINVVVEYPPIQCSDPNDNKETLVLFAGENLKRALQTRGIVFEDRDAAKCDFCGQKCMVEVDLGLPLMNPMGLTEEKLLKRNPKCRVSDLVQYCRLAYEDVQPHEYFCHDSFSQLACKTIVGHNMQEGNVRLKINLNEWKSDDKKSSNPFFSR